MMQRPRNRQGIGPSQVDRGRGGRGRGRGRGGRQPDFCGPSNVPSINQVVSGSPVSIVLKVDQPTGREVQGIVADVLTNGNHPRGIKVRLSDGRVGRVQRMVSGEEARTGSAGLVGLGRYREGASDVPRSAPRGRDRDVREGEIPAPGYSLGDFLPAGHFLREDNFPATAEKIGSTSTCPVCGEFEGDEVAVSHHVNTHFD